MSSIHLLKTASGETQYTSFATLSAALLAGADGDRATLYGPTTWIGTWMNKAGAVVLDSTLRLWAAAGTEFSLGADGDGDDIETFDTASAPTWGAAGASTGGLILDGSGACILPCIGVFDPAVLLVCVKCVPTTVNALAGAGFGAGAFSSTRTKAFFGGIYYSSSSWYRKYALMTTAPTISPGGGVGTGYDVALAADDDVLVDMMWAASDRASNFGSYIAGGYRGDEVGASANQQTSSGSSALVTGATDHEFGLHCSDAGGAGLVVRFHEISITAVSL